MTDIKESDIVKQKTVYVPDIYEKIKTGWYERQAKQHPSYKEESMEDLKDLQRKHIIYHEMLDDLQQVCQYFLPFLPFIVVINLMQQAKREADTGELTYEEELYLSLQRNLFVLFNFDLENMEKLEAKQ